MPFMIGRTFDGRVAGGWSHADLKRALGAHYDVQDARWAGSPHDDVPAQWVRDLGAQVPTAPVPEVGRPGPFEAGSARRAPIQGGDLIFVYLVNQGWQGAYFPAAVLTAGMTDEEAAAYRRWEAVTNAVCAAPPASAERDALILALDAAEEEIRRVDTGATALLAMCGLAD